MVQTVSRSRILLSTTLLAFSLGSGHALAQSVGSFATAPLAATPAGADGPIAKPGTLPVVMFRSKTPVSTPKRPDITARDIHIEAHMAVPETSAVAPAPSTTPGTKGKAKGKRPNTSAKKTRGPFRRIFEDTRRSVVRDIPEALADAIPWVDKGQKSEEFDAVLSRVAGDLSAAAHHDPEWALGAEREIRHLSKTLATFPAPPSVSQPSDASPQSIGENGFLAPTAGRPFRPRPIWPGASGRPEAQVRPVTVVTYSGQQSGPRAMGVADLSVDSVEESPIETSLTKRKSQRKARRLR